MPNLAGELAKLPERRPAAGLDAGEQALLDILPELVERP